jgi:hypothetical protein
MKASHLTRVQQEKHLQRASPACAHMLANAGVRCTTGRVKQKAPLAQHTAASKPTLFIMIMTRSCCA